MEMLKNFKRERDKEKEKEKKKEKEAEKEREKEKKDKKRKEKKDLAATSNDESSRSASYEVPSISIFNTSSPPGAVTTSSSVVGSLALSEGEPKGEETVSTVSTSSSSFTCSPVVLIETTPIGAPSPFASGTAISSLCTSITSSATSTIPHSHSVTSINTLIDKEKEKESKTSSGNTITTNGSSKTTPQSLSPPKALAFALESNSLHNTVFASSTVSNTQAASVPSSSSSCSPPHHPGRESNYGPPPASPTSIPPPPPPLPLQPSAEQDDIEGEAKLFMENPRGFLNYLDSGDFADVCLATNEREYRVHRIIISYSSVFFAELLQKIEEASADPSISSSLLSPSFASNSSSTESSSASSSSSYRIVSLSPLRIQLVHNDPDNAFELLIQFLYAGNIHITDENSFPLRSLADHYQIRELKDLIDRYMSVNISRENVLYMLKRAMLFGAEEMIEKCLHVVARNFAHIYDANYDFLPPAMFLRLLQHEFLSVRDEYELYNSIMRYIEQRGDVTPQMSSALLEMVRYRWFTHNQLTEVVNHPLIPQNLVVEQLMAKLESYERPSSSINSSSSLSAVTPLPLTHSKSDRLAPRPIFGIQFHYKSDFDDRGIFMWIGSNSGRSPWENPALTGKVTVSPSSVEKGQVHYLLERVPKEIWTKDVPASWFTIDLGPARTVIAHHYSLRHGANYKADSLRTWDLKGSNDQINWTLLSRHTNDDALSGPYATHTWSIPLIPSGGPPTPYRYFKILQTGHNSSNHNFLVLSGFELYGELFENSRGFL